YGFIFDSKRKRFVKEIKGGMQVFDLLFYAYPNEILVKPVFKIKLHLIEDIYHQVTQKEKSYNEETQTLGNSLGQIMKHYDNSDRIGTTEDISYKIENEDDIEILKKVIPERFKEYILPYFNKNSSIEQVDKLLNEFPRELSIHNRPYPIRACIAIIAARLVRNPNYNELLKIYDEETVDANPENRKEFEDLAKLLEKEEY
ncbi:MAG: hypothetical protein ABL876_14660, partial [Chitinophagaceae bacterium]